MATNIEIKARVDDFEALRTRAEALSDKPLEIIPQEDTFFNTTKGRLKLRLLAPNRGISSTMNAPIKGALNAPTTIWLRLHDPENLKMALSLALGIRGVVRKTRYLYMPDKRASIWMMWKGWVISWNWKSSCGKTRVTQRDRPSLKI